MVRSKHAILFAVLSTPAFVGCKSAVDEAPAAKVNQKKADTKRAEEADPKPDPKPATGALEVDVAASKIEFVGAKVTADHTGRFADFSGQAVLDGDEATSVSFTVQTASVEIEPAKLQSHLRTDDFFAVEQFPVAKFTSTKVEAKPDGDNTHSITGDLELRGVENEITFPAKITVDDTAATGSARFTINRKNWGIEYRGMEDDLIKDDVLLVLELKFPRK